jgi:hypothetical protein
MKLTVSTDGVDHRIGSEPVDCHKVAGIEYVRHYGDRAAQTVKLDLMGEDALGLAYDLLFQAVDAGLIEAWNVSFPDRVLAAETRS